MKRKRRGGEGAEGAGAVAHSEISLLTKEYKFTNKGI